MNDARVKLAGFDRKACFLMSTACISNRELVCSVNPHLAVIIYSLSHGKFVCLPAEIVVCVDTMTTWPE